MDVLEKETLIDKPVDIKTKFIYIFMVFQDSLPKRITIVHYTQN